MTVTEEASNSKVDLIFVLAGRQSRKLFGLELYGQGFAPSLLLSVARYEIRGFEKLPLPRRFDLRSIAAPVNPPERHFFVCFAGDAVTVDRITRGRYGTLSEIRALGEWLRSRQSIRRIAIISGRTHLPRIRLCCRHLLPPEVQCDFIPVPPQLTGSPSDFPPANEEGAAFRLIEFLKRQRYRLVLLRESRTRSKG